MEFQRVMDRTLAEYLQAKACIDNILVVIKRSEIDQISTVDNLKENRFFKKRALKVTKGNFAKNCERLGYKITSTGVTPLNRKAQPTKALKPTRTLFQLKLFMGSIQSLHKLLLALAESSAPQRSLLSRKKEYIWTPE